MKPIFKHKEESPKSETQEKDLPKKNVTEKMPQPPIEPMYYIQKDGYGNEYKLANMNNLLVCKRKGVIEIEAIKRDKNKQANISFCTVKKNGIIFGIFQEVDNLTKKIIYKRFNIPEFKRFDLTDPDQAEEWAIFRHHESIVGPRPIFKIYDVEHAAQEEITKISLIEEAVGIAKNMKLKDWIPVARFFGKQPEGMSAILLQSEIMKLARNTPAEVIDYWNMENREIVDIYNSAKSLGLISHDMVKGWLYKKALPMGNTEQIAIRFMIKDAVFSKSVEQEVRNMDVTAKNIMGGADDDITLGVDESKALFDLKLKANLHNIVGYDKMSEDELRKRVDLAEMDIS